MAPTPYQRDLSPAHAKRLQEVVRKIERFAGGAFAPILRRVDRFLPGPFGKTLPAFEATFAKLAANIEAFDVAKVRYEDLQRAALATGPAGD